MNAIIGRLRPYARQAAVPAFLVMLAVIAYFTLVFPGSLPDHWLVAGWNDVILHAGAFAALSVFAFAFRPVDVTTIAMLVAFAAGFEGAQVFVPGREADLRDIGANLGGIVSAVIWVRVVRYAWAIAVDSSKSIGP